MHEEGKHKLFFLVGSREDAENVALTANFIFVARDYKTGKAALVNRLSPETEEEKALFEAADSRNKLRKRKRGGDRKENKQTSSIVIRRTDLL